MSRLYRQLPHEIQTVLLTSEGWLVGSAVRKLLNHETVSDYDIIVPNRELFQIIIKQLASGFSSEVNSFGGFKCKNDRVTIDIWCEELDHFLKTANHLDLFYNMKKNILIGKVDG